MDENDLLQWVTGLELASEHPLAQAIVNGAKERGITPANVGDFESITGKGVRSTVVGKVQRKRAS